MSCGLACVLAIPAHGQGANAGTLTLIGTPSTLRISTAVAGSDPDPVTSTGLQYTARAGKASKPQKIMVNLNTAMPTGVTLTLDMVAPAGAQDDGTVTLDATARELVGNITNTTATTQSMTYTLSATAAAGVIALTSRTVTFTITSWP
jgi:hypothetical protein